MALFFSVLFCLVFFLASGSFASDSSVVHVDAQIVEELEQSGTARVIVVMEEDTDDIKPKAALAKALSESKGSRQYAKAAISHQAAEEQIKADEQERSLAIERTFSSFNGFTAEVSGQGLEALENDPSVKAVFIDREVHATLDASIPLINGTKANEIVLNGTNLTGKGQSICIIDTGIDTDHPYFTGRIIDEKCFCNGCCAGSTNEANTAEDDESHGTHVAGIAAGNHSTYRGLAYEANLVAVKVLDSAGDGLFSDVISAIDWCTNVSSQLNISVISMSLGDSGQNNAYCNSHSTASAINAAAAKNISVVVSSGNNAYTAGISAPACVESAIPVGGVYDANVGGIAWSACTDSSTSADKMVCHTNRGLILDILAPGSQIVSANNNNGTTTKGGTSMAAPHVSGLIALMRQFVHLQNGTNLTHTEAENALISSGITIDDTSSSGKNYSRVDAYEAILYLDTLAPVITFTNSSLANLSYVSTNQIVNITSNEVLQRAWIQINNTNTTLNGSASSWWINLSYLVGFAHDYVVYGNDSSGNIGASESRLANVQNQAPQVSNLQINSTDSRNRTNGTLSISYSVSDVNADSITNETHWYNNSVLTLAFANTSTVHSNFTFKNQNWTFSVRFFDGTSYSSWSNVSIGIRNSAPQIDPLSNISVNESEQLNITVNASDGDTDALAYTINNSNFGIEGSTFIWNTTINDSGTYVLNITVNDSESLSYVTAYATIIDAIDNDGDAVPDYKDTDDDNDGLNDSVDYLLGNVSSINASNIGNVSVFLNGSLNLSQVFNTTLLVNVSSENVTVIEFNWTFNATNILDLYNLTIIRHTTNSSNSSLLIRGLNLAAQNTTKNVFLDRRLNGTGICIEDKEINSIDDISADCTASGEAWLACPGTSANYTCSFAGNSTQYYVTGLSHSGVREQSTYCGDNTCNGAESCSSCSTDCGSCPSSSSSSSGGGGGGGGGGGSFTTPDSSDRLSSTFVSMRSGETYTVKGGRENLAVTSVSFSIDKFILKGEVVVEKKALPSSIPVAKGAYQYFEITPSVQLTSSDVVRAQVEYRIPLFWIEDNDIDTTTIALLRYNNLTDEWERYAANRLKQDSDFVHYSSSIPGFSYFAIVGDKKEVEEAEVVEEVAVAVANESTSEPEGNSTGLTSKDEKENTINLFLLGVIVFVLLLVSTWYMLNKTNSNKGKKKKK